MGPVWDGASTWAVGWHLTPHPEFQVPATVAHVALAQRDYFGG